MDDPHTQLDQLPVTKCTLLFLVSNNKILLAMKKRGFGEGKLNGVGGKIEPGESPREACIRESQEEISVTPTLFTKVADLHFLEWYKGTQQRVHIDAYICEEWQGDPEESEEVVPEWHSCEDIPYDKMWDDDQYWLPQALAGEKLVGKFVFNKDNQIISHNVVVHESLPAEVS